MKCGSSGQGKAVDRSLTTRHPLPRAFYARPAVTVARSCIGKILVHASAEGTVAGRIVETEAYQGPRDRAAHSFGGRRTRRTEVMFGAPGHAYVFFVYGMHWNFNVVTGAEGEPQAVLIRAVEPVAGSKLIEKRRGRRSTDASATNGPGKLTSAFAITGEHYGMDVCRFPLTLLDGPRVRVARSKRIGIDYAGDWADKLWRFYDPKSRFVSRTPHARPK